MWPFLVDNLKEVIRELQDFAEKKYNAEEAECPQRIVRLSTANGSGSITRLQTVPLHSRHCKHQFRILLYSIFLYTNISRL